MKENQENQNEYYKSLNAKIPLAEEVVKEIYQKQIEIVKQQQRDIVKMGITQSISFVNIVPNSYPELVRRNGLVFGLNEIPGGERNRKYVDAGIYTPEYNKIYNRVGVSKKPLGYLFGLSVTFPKVIHLNMNAQDLENKLKENGLNPSSVKEAKPKHKDQYKNFETKPMYQVFFNYEITKEKIDYFRNPHTKDPKETIRNDFRKGIGETLEKAINCIIDLKMEKYPD